ncbi:STN domain-containing protein [Rhodopseudomonas sp. RCAM05734]|uniref:STN domain-containing protein n=1 Tax=Rhodopseudomonas sp. RCAM05734 TaxID=3457549 RepID=UPI004044B585
MRGRTECEPGRGACVDCLHRLFGDLSALVIAASLVLVPQGTASAQAPKSSGQLQFDIPSQSLAASLKVYRAVTNHDLYYESSLIEAHRSSAVVGAFLPDVALRRLLKGTGLSVASFEPGTLTILPGRPVAPERDLPALRSKAAEFSSYFTRIQASLRAAFCRTPEIQLVPSELIVRLWISQSGAVARAELLQPTGSEERDLAYATAMRRLVIDQAPPTAMPQPVTLMVLPRTSRIAAECPQSDGNAP